MQLQLRTWQEVDAYLNRSTGIILPIGSTEQHGPNGFIGTDAICPELIARGAGERLGAMVAPTVSVGMAQHHLGFAGSITLRPTTLIAVISDMVNSLASHGFDRFFFLNGHGGNIATVTAAFSEIYAQSSLGVAGANRPAVRCALQNWWMLPKVQALREREFGASEGRHATPSEVALTYYGYPEEAERIKDAALSPRIAPTGPVVDAEDYRRRFPDGRIGSDPSLATVALGAALYETAVEDACAAFRAFLEAA